ncbi:hypothetical protein [Paenibacillus riograndensis]|uniref:Uncharacterized protein n=1 Tax=Paenibacillus riograndensis SBR5 TaxID=1073571 RepID=A0A0E4CZR4_9BACL|nr:hypothetical protein [Paenibacillus riograndensis]CQR58820.1 hypothetical protein PRIO_6473 [Paenibacillus riograndensis SBR5]
MNRNDVKSALGVIAISGGLLGLSAFAVPHIVAYTEMNRQVPEAHVSYEQQHTGKPAVQLASSQIPVLKIEAEAPVSTIQAYLENTVTEEEIKQYNAYAEKLRFMDAPKLTRPMTEQESNRSLILDDQYRFDGLRPKQKLPMKAGNYEFYLDDSKATLVFPKRALTDEELLQFIDWNYRLNYVLSLNYVKPQPDQKDIGEAEALGKARESVARLFDVDLSKMEGKASYNKSGPEQKGVWFVHFQPYRVGTLQAQGKPYFMYNVFIDSLSGTVIDSTIVEMAYKRTPITAEMNGRIRQDSSWLQAARTIVADKQGDTREIAGTTIIKDSIYDKRGVVAVLVKLKDGSSYTAELRYPEKKLRCLIYTPASPASKS